MNQTPPKKAKYLELAQYFNQQIRDGQLLPGERLPSFAQMREQFGVTPATVERLYSLLERERLIERRYRSGVYVAEPAASPTIRGTLGFVTSGFSQPHLHPYNYQLLQGVQGVAEKAGVQIMLLDHGAIAAGRDKVDGLLIYKVNLPGTKQGKGARIERDIFGLPCVSMLTVQPEASSVVADEVGGGRAATEHLLGLGHRRIACLMGSDPEQGIDVLGNQRIQGCEEALNAVGLALDPRCVQPLIYNVYSNYFEIGLHQMSDWLAGEWNELGCTAILTQNDETAFGVIQALQRHGLRVPEDVSVVGYDGIVAPGHFAPILTTVQVPLERISSEATQMLLRKIGGDRGMEHQVIPVAVRQGGTAAEAAYKSVNEQKVGNPARRHAVA